MRMILVSVFASVSSPMWTPDTLHVALTAMVHVPKATSDLNLTNVRLIYTVFKNAACYQRSWPYILME